MKIIDVIASPGLTGFYFDDQLAIKSGVEHDGFTYLGSRKRLVLRRFVNGVSLFR